MKYYEDPANVRMFGEMWAAEHKQLDQIAQAMLAELPPHVQVKATVEAQRKSGAWEITIKFHSGYESFSFTDSDLDRIAAMIRRTFAAPGAGDDARGA